MTIYDIPAEIVIYICKFLSPKDILNFALTSNYIYHSLARHIKRRKDDAYKTAKKMFKYGMQNTYLSIRYQSITCIPNMVCNIRTLEEIITYHSLGINELPTDMYLLNNLQVLKIINGNLTSFPLQILDLINLNELVLIKNFISFKIDEKIDFYKLNNLEILNLSYNFIKYVPNEINQLKNLKELKLSQNCIFDFPYIKKLKNLEHLDISHNFIKSIKISSKKLKYLDAQSNNIEQIHKLKLPNIDILNIRKNKLIFIPKCLYRLKTLNFLRINYNYINELSDNISNLKNLKLLNISHNKLCSMPNSIKKLKKLLYLDISYNEFEKIPPSVINIKNLQVLDISFNYGSMFIPKLPNTRIYR